jgi:hypothetical protein
MDRNLEALGVTEWKGTMQARKTATVSIALLVHILCTVISSAKSSRSNKKG